MNKYKLVPYLVLSKEDAQIETMQKELTKLLNDKSIDDSSKRALYEDLLNKITRFKEMLASEKTVQFKVPALPPPPSSRITAAVDTQTEPIFNHDDDEDFTADGAIHGSTPPSSVVSPVVSPVVPPHPPPTPTSNTTHRTMATPRSERGQNMSDTNDDDQFELASPSGRHGRRVRQERKRTQQQQQLEDISPSTTRGGIDYSDPSLEGNRKLGKKKTWNHAVHPKPWK